MLGGAGAGANIATAASAANRAGFVTALVARMNSLGYDGIDLDWEDCVNLDDLVSLAQALRAANPKLVLTYPAGTINGNYPDGRPQDGHPGAVARPLQRTDVLPVDRRRPGRAGIRGSTARVSGETGTTPIAIDDTLARYAAAGIPKAKLGMGMASTPSATPAASTARASRSRTGRPSSAATTNIR